MPNKIPDFLIIGAAKAGTTSLYYYLKQHPQVFMSPVKEPDFFGGNHWNLPIRNIDGPNPGFEIYRQWDQYKKLFVGSQNELRIGEASPSTLLFYEESIPRIKQYLDHPKIIILLRNPVDRAYSHYSFFRRDEKENLTFEEAIDMEDTRRKSNFHYGYMYRQNGFYSSQVEAFQRNFNEVFIGLYDDLHHDPIKFLKEVLDFLELDKSISIDANTKYNVSGIPKNKSIHKFFIKKNAVRDLIRPIVDLFLNENAKAKVLATINRRNLSATPKIAQNTRSRLISEYKLDIVRLEKLIQRDLSHWLT